MAKPSTPEFERENAPQLARLRAQKIGYCPECKKDTGLNSDGRCYRHFTAKIATSSSDLVNRYHNNARRCVCPSHDRCLGDSRGDRCEPQRAAETAFLGLFHRGVLLEVADWAWSYE